MKILARSNTENYLESAAVKAATGIDCQIPVCGKPTDTAGNVLGKRTLRQVKDAGPAVALQMGAAGIVGSSALPGGGSE